MSYAIDIDTSLGITSNSSGYPDRYVAQVTNWVCLMLSITNVDQDLCAFIMQLFSSCPKIFFRHRHR